MTPTKWGYEPPVVTWEPTMADGVVTGYAAQPPFGLEWPSIRSLQHYAALVEHRTGVTLRVVVRDDEHEDFEIMTPHSVTGNYTYLEAMNWMRAYEVGFNEAAQRRAEEEPGQ